MRDKAQMEHERKLKCELYNDNFQNFRSYNIQKAQLRDMYNQVCASAKEESVNKFVLGECKLLDDKCIKLLN